MENKFEKLYVDYFDTTSSYVKAILDELPETMVSNSDRSIIKELYNYIVNDATDARRKEISYVSAMLMEKISLVKDDDFYKQAEYLYTNFLKRMIYDSINRKKFFDILTECIKVYVGYYSEYEYLSVVSPNEISRERGRYR